MMTAPPAPEQPHLVSLVLQSKKALHHGEQLCSKAHSLSNASAQASVDVLVLDAKVRWITDNVLEQLKLAAAVAKSIEEKRDKLSRQVQEWDIARAKQSDALDNILNELGSQRVPPDFHQTSAESSLFGSQNSEDEDETRQPNGHTLLSQSPSDTVRIPKAKPQVDRRNWKTLRDFVDDQAIDDILENMEDDRTTVEDVVGKIHDYPETLNTTIAAIRNTLPHLASLPAIEQLLASQDSAIVRMAGHLESLAAHYDQMAGALRDSEAGEAFSDEDVQDMNRDTDELPSIMAELEEGLNSVQVTQDLLSSVRATSHEHIQKLSRILDDLDELGEIMMEMVQTQEAVEAECEERLNDLQQHLLTVEHLHQRFLSYQTAFRKLILELARRRLYKESAENIVRGMMAQLEAMTEEERRVREHFNEEHGAHLPEDLCLCISNTPTKWEVVPWNGESLEALPDIASDLISEVKEQLRRNETVTGTDSLYFVDSR